ncbi:three-Cys-motif partner protein TcmP [Marinobacter sp. R17]|uniref:three-Cys-motif partner protein TcmP n=1 Tax=Marinobacter sp. R17 TaxID=2484250 RepID=UPI000F4C68DD|nr:three-Cys-motif partner protein TcmP [Marinobacter sp. R17]ROT94362.1 three-Cys-motif partner protein TcmP [Marinobacter sp. R17]
MPAKNGYDWSDLSNPPHLDRHSSVKHEIICEYLSRYIGVFTKNPMVDRFRINLIDGFAGGGRYRSLDSSDILAGSPILLLRTMKEAEAKVNVSRLKPFSIDAHYYFVEIDKGAVNHLELALTEDEFDQQPNVHVLHNDFLQALPSIAKDIQSRSRKPRNIFILDQYGYKDVPPATIRKIFEMFPSGTEVLLTFSTDSLINHLSGDAACVKRLEKCNMEGILKHPDLQNAIEVKQSRLLIEQLLYQEIQSQCGASFYTPFFIMSRSSNRAYWLIHLSSHPTARNEMLMTHWQSQNSFVHHGGQGLSMMLGYDPTFEAVADQQTFDFYFDDNADQRVLDALMRDIPEFIERSQSFTVQDLVFKTCNTSPATLAQYKSALFQLQQHQVLRVMTASGQTRRSASAISFDDGIMIESQLHFLL